MQTTLLCTGLACVIAAIVGGGLKAFDIEIPAFDSIPRQIALFAVGVSLVLTSGAIHPPPINMREQSAVDSSAGEASQSEKGNGVEGASKSPGKVDILFKVHKIFIDDFAQDNADFRHSLVQFDVGTYTVRDNMTHDFGVQRITLPQGNTDVDFYLFLAFNKATGRHVLYGHCTTTITVDQPQGDEPRLYTWTITIDSAKGISSCSVQ